MGILLRQGISLMLGEAVSNSVLLDHKDRKVDSKKDARIK